MVAYSNAKDELILADSSGINSVNPNPVILLRDVTLESFHCTGNTRILGGAEGDLPIPPEGEVLGRCFIDITGALRPVPYETPTLLGTVWVIREGRELVLLDSTQSVNQEIFRVRTDLRIEWSPSSPYGREDRRTDQYWPFCTEDLLPSFKETSRVQLHPTEGAKSTPLIVLEEATGDEAPVPIGGLSVRHLLESGMDLGKAFGLSMREYHLHMETME